MAYAPTLTAFSDMVPVPRVQVRFNTVDPAAITATVYRLYGTRTWRVRGAIRVSAAGGFSVTDYEVPLGGVSVSYRAEMFDAGGMSLGFTDPAATSVAFTGTIIHQPLDPSRAVKVMALKGSAGSLERPFEGSLVRAQGRTLPVWIGSGRGGIEDVALSFKTETLAEEQAMIRVFGDYGDAQIPVICLRTTLNFGIPQPFFGLVRNPKSVPIDKHVGGTAVAWNLQSDEAAPPVEALVVTALTYLDLETFFATYGAFEAAYLTYLDAESDYTKAGVA